MTNLKSTLESRIEDYLSSRAAILGGRSLKLRPSVGRGFPDRTLLMPFGWVAFVEVKRTVGGVVAVQQDKWRRSITELGHRHYLVASKEDVDQLFKDFRRETGTGV